MSTFVGEIMKRTNRVLQAGVVIVVVGGPAARHIAEELAETLIVDMFYDLPTLIADRPRRAVLFAGPSKGAMSTEAVLLDRGYTPRRLLIEDGLAA